MNLEKENSLNQAQRHFIDGLFSLMKEKSFEDITVQELSEKAQYDRRTYYRYFKCKEDILRLYCADILKEMALSMKQEKALTFKSGITAYFSFWWKHMDFLKLLDKNSLLHFLADEQDALIYYNVGTSVQNNIPESLEEAEPISKYSFYFTSGGLWNTLVHWIKEPVPRSPQEMTNYIVTMLVEIGNIIYYQK